MIVTLSEKGEDMRYTVGSGAGFDSPQLGDIDFDKNRVIAMTCHRRENYGAPMRNIFSAVRDMAGRFPDVLVVYPVHLSPVVRDAAYGILGDVPNVKLIEPLDAMGAEPSCCLLTVTPGGEFTWEFKKI